MRSDCHQQRYLKKLYQPEETSAYPLYDKDKSGTEGKTTVRPLANVIQKKKSLDSPILIAGFPGPGLVGSIST